MKHRYIERGFTRVVMDRIRVMNAVIEEWQGMGYTLTLRQLYYQLVQANVIPNTVQEYNKIGETLNDARLAGLVDWEAIEDRGRLTYGKNHSDDPFDVFPGLEAGFNHDLWRDQPWYVEVMYEKDALSQIVGRASNTLDVPYSPNKGYSSASTMRKTGLRLKEALEAGKDVAVIYLGDHDPSGMDMTRDVDDRLKMFAEYHRVAGREADGRTIVYEPTEIAADRRFVVDRIALNMPQIVQYGPPENPAKRTDSRYTGYRNLYGESSWELDALRPDVLREIVIEAIGRYTDAERMTAARIVQADGRKLIRTATDFVRRARPALVDLAGMSVEPPIEDVEEPEDFEE